MALTHAEGKKFNGRTFIRDEELKECKFAVRYKGEDKKVFYVSPAVYDLIDSDFKAVAKKLVVRERSRGRRAGGRKS